MDFEQLIRQHDLATLKNVLVKMSGSEIASVLQELENHDRGVLFRLLPKDRAVDVFEQLPAEDQQALLQSLQDNELIHLISELAPDDRVRLFDELPAKVAKRLLACLSPEKRDATAMIMGYDADSAGRIMTPDYVSLRQDMTVGEALEKVRRVGMDKETIYTIYVTDDERRLQGVISLRELVLGDPRERVGNLMKREIVYVHTDDDQEVVAKAIKDHNLLAVPVLDKEDRLVGIVTFDDAIDVLESEATEDFQRLMALTDTARAERYFQLGLLLRVARRLPWLAVLALSGAISGTIMSSFERVITAAVALAFFIPMITDTAGNTGSQASTLVVRGLATGEVKSKDIVPVFIKEALTGLLMGLPLGGAALLMVIAITRDTMLGVAVGSAILGVVVSAGLIGVALPFFFKWIRVDPAVASAPLITTIGDIVGLLIYFSLAQYLYRRF